MTRLPIASYHLRCKDGCLISILEPHRRLDRSAEDETEIVDPPVRMRAVPEDPAVLASGLAAFWRHHNRREGDDAEYAPVPVAIVRAFVRLHGGVAEAGEEALAELKRAAALEKPDPVMGEPVAIEDPAARLRIDALTPAVIAARRVVAAGARVGPDRYAALAALVVVTDERYAAHPLHDEGTRLKEVLSTRVPEQA